jgi:hypothetical protein
MAQFRKTELILDHKFDPLLKRHFLNGQLTVLHCHHFSTLYTQLALDARQSSLLAEIAEDSFVDVLKDYFKQHALVELGERASIACQYYAAVGLGKLAMNYLGPDSGQVDLERSHIDEGWIKKWGNHDCPVNYITAGFVAAMFAAILDLPARSFEVHEISSMAMGAPKGCFSVVRR